MNGDEPGLVLHVDDEQPVRDALAMLLRSYGYQVRSAADGPDALVLAGAGFQPDVLIADFNLEAEMNGAEVAEQIRRVLGYTPPVIMLTGDLSNVEFPAITDAPVWITRKPLNPELLLAALPGLVQLSRAIRSMPTGVARAGK